MRALGSLPLLSFTTKQASLSSSIDQGGGERRTATNAGGRDLFSNVANTGGGAGSRNASLYTEAADRKRLALEAMAKVQGKQNEIATSIPAPGRKVREPGRKDK